MSKDTVSNKLLGRKVGVVPGLENVWPRKPDVSATKFPVFPEDLLHVEGEIVAVWVDRKEGGIKVLTEMPDGAIHEFHLTHLRLLPERQVASPVAPGALETRIVPLIPLVAVPAGTFVMGSPTDEPERFTDEVQREVWITRSILIGVTPVTQGQWCALMGNNPSHFHNGGDDVPVEEVSWYDAVAFCNALSRRERLEEAYILEGEKGTPGTSGYEIQEVRFRGLSCQGYRLPTEAEWEHACRAGTTGARYGDIEEIAWHEKNSRGHTQPVGRKRPNRWGLHDMLGNVWEWCWDRHGMPLAGPPLVDPVGPASGGDARVLHGGAWNVPPGIVRAAYRGCAPPGSRDHAFGFRCVRTLPGPGPGPGPDSPKED